MRTYAPQPNTVLYDLEEQCPIKGWIWVDLAAGLLEGYQLDSFGNIKMDRQGNYLTYTARGKFRLHRVREGALAGSGNAVRGSSPIRVPGGAPFCALCKSPLTLPGEDLCTVCKAKDSAYLRMLNHLDSLRSLPTLPGAGSCAHRGCNRPGVYAVGHEVIVSPIVSRTATFGLRLFKRGATVGRLYFCPWHWTPPLLLDKKGEVIEKQEHGFGVRP